jgi:predicted membrane protein
MGAFIPEWVFTWQMLLIAIGTYIGLKHAFRTFGWIVIVLVGVAFLIKDYMPWIQFGKFFWPITIILVGLVMIFRPKRPSCRTSREWQKIKYTQTTSPIDSAAEDFLDFNAIFGGIKKNVITKTFRGGEINAIFGGAEINLMQADFTGVIELEANCIFGGTRLVIPGNWTVKSEIAAVMGSVEDKRHIMKDVVADPDKVLILRGNAIFGGLEIQSFA